MNRTPPDVVAVDRDDYHAQHVGRTADGRQFFLTPPFVPASRGAAGAEFNALYVFDDDGALLDARIEPFGPRGSYDRAMKEAAYWALLDSLGTVSFERIEVAPFAIERFDTTFGLVVRDCEDDDDVLAVEVQPGNHMAFFEPWDSGEYDT